MPFNVSGIAKVLKIDPKKGTSDDAHVLLAVKLKVEDVPASAITAALGAESAADIETALFKPKSVDADQNSRFLGLKHIACEASWDSKHTITFAGFREIRVAKVGAVQIRPRGYLKCDVTFVVTIEQPPQGYQEQLTEYLQRTLRVELQHDRELFDGDPPSDAQAAAPAAAKPQRGRPAGSKNAAKKAA
jgi:hypothetical protein